MSFDPYESLLRNFSKHKFKLFIEKSILSPESHADYQITHAANVFKDKWETDDLAHMDMPTRMGFLFGITSYNRWIW